MSKVANQIAKSKLFNALHLPGKPLVLFNIWDPGSARAVASSGAQALATGSWSVASAFGFEDGEKLPLALAIENLARIVQATDLPVSIDLESGYSMDSDGIANSIELAIAAGAVGCNIEDSAPGNGPLRSIGEQVARINCARAAAQSVGFDFFINARCDVFLQAPVENHNLVLLELAIERGLAYAKAGASGLFLPGLQDLSLIKEIVPRSALPINIMQGSSAIARQQLAEAGAARISHGPGPYALAMQHLKDAAALALR